MGTAELMSCKMGKIEVCPSSQRTDFQHNGRTQMDAQMTTQ